MPHERQLRAWILVRESPRTFSHTESTYQPGQLLGAAGQLSQALQKVHQARHDDVIIQKRSGYHACHVATMCICTQALVAIMELKIGMPLAVAALA